MTIGRSKVRRAAAAIPANSMVVDTPEGVVAAELEEDEDGLVEIGEGFVDGVLDDIPLNPPSKGDLDDGTGTEESPQERAIPPRILAPERGVAEGSVAIPLRTPLMGSHATTIVSVTNLTRRQARGLKALAEGLMAKQAVQGKKSRQVRSAADAVRWLCDQLADEMDRVLQMN